ncbi:MAG: hypothetical protein AVDCRST_MAG69-355, partial [uncultured Solirubrobacteraceae bacterium]
WSRGGRLRGTSTRRRPGTSADRHAATPRTRHLRRRVVAGTRLGRERRARRSIHGRARDGAPRDAASQRTTRTS